LLARHKRFIRPVLNPWRRPLFFSFCMALVPSLDAWFYDFWLFSRMWDAVVGIKVMEIAYRYGSASRIREKLQLLI
jgi:hypothetical protein